MSRNATVAALSSGLVPSGVAIIRISGPLTRFALETLSGSVPEPRFASLRTLKNPANGVVLDHALVLFFPAPHSFTGEDVGEMHCHGSRAVVDGVLAALWSLDGIGPAQAGDFTRQAFANGKMDLVQVEALGDLIHASTAGQRDLALSHLSGSASRKLTQWRDRLVHARAMIEAELDFSDEDDVPGSVLDSLPEQLRVLSVELKADLEDQFSERLREGFRVVLAGAPNSGKSTLMNALLEREAALVSPVAGTTRDRIDAAIDLDGLPVLLSDTAGLRDAGDVSDPVEVLGIDRARDALDQADCIIWLEGGDQAAESYDDERSIRIRSKSDLRDENRDEDSTVLAVSGRTGEGLVALKQHMRATLVERYQGSAGSDRVANETISVDARRRSAVNQALNGLHAALSGLSATNPHLDLIAEDLRVTQLALGAISGDVDAEGVLDVVFSSFCIGK
ncbi:MAG: tRNA uridine-5-carboxymethylaminomethyl(34) synthesis GTPase MnmE [Hyphomicrobiales bacterium]